MKFASLELDFMDLPDTGNARRYDNARNYSLLNEINRTGIHMSQIFEVIPTWFSGHTTSLGQGDSQGATFANANSRPVYDAFYDLENERIVMHEVMVSGSGNHRGEVEEVGMNRFVQHVRIRLLVIGA